MDLKCKFCFLGDQSVGKTSLLVRYVNGTFTENYKSTLGADFLITKFNLKDLLEFETTGIAEEAREEFDSTKIHVYIWDLGGQHAFNNLRGHYLVGANATIIVFDVTNCDSFEHLPNWVQQNQRLKMKVPFVIVGNKVDLKAWCDDFLAPKQDIIQKYAPKEVFFTSAKTGEGVKDLFSFLLRQIFTKDKIKELF